MRIVVALGGNALLRRGEPMTVEAQRANLRAAATALATLYRGNELVITHGNGPQIGLLASHDVAGPLDVLGAESEGMIGYMLEQELRNAVPSPAPIATLLTMVEVDGDDPNFANPTKFIGPVYSRSQAQRLAAKKGWLMKEDGTVWRRVVASPSPKRIFEIQPIEWLLEKGAVVIAAGGGGIPIVSKPGGGWRGVEAVIDKDLCSELLARTLDADVLLLATDVDAAYADWGTPSARAIRRANPTWLRGKSFPAGSMGPKIAAACTFAETTGKRAVIGGLGNLGALLHGTAGTTVTQQID
ncbi:MAG TPA: carbamate kinase, partial [Stellaceae bacterium]|nr:carbamate kinase [Stellaceae bacterium]